MATEKMVTVKDLAKATGMTPKKIRRKLRAAKMGVGFGNAYEWPAKGVDIQRVRKLLSPPKEEEKKAEPKSEPEVKPVTEPVTEPEKTEEAKAA